MSKDKALEELFLAQKPHFDDKADFMSALNRRLDAVEYVRQHQEATIRRYKMAMVVAFIVGVVSGAVTLAFVLSMPADMPLFTVHVQSGILVWLAENSRIILTTLLALLMSLGMMSIISNTNRDTRRRRMANSRQMPVPNSKADSKMAAPSVIMSGAY